MNSSAELVPFVADSVEDAVAQVRARLGPSAVVVHVRRVQVVGGHGLFKRRKHRLEILAYRPEETAPQSSAADSTSTPSAPTGAQSPPAHVLDVVTPDSAPLLPTSDAETTPRSGGGNWRVGALLESAGFLPANAQRVVDELRRQHGDDPPGAVAAEIALARSVLSELWRRRPGARQTVTRGPHVLVGAPGTGKTTCLCKWLTKTVLVESRPARVWRLDGQRANTAESLSIYCEILGVPLERSWQGAGEPDEEMFVDLPGVDWRDGAAVRALLQQIATFGSSRLHLVLNGAYETSLLLQQVRAFSLLPLEDLMVTHLDEETRWGKVWNLVLGTNYSVGFVSAGQNIPGEFFMATAESLFSRQFPS